MKAFYLLLVNLLVVTSIFAQNKKETAIIEKYIQENMAEWKLTAADIADLKVDYAYQSDHNGLTHIYLKQQYEGIEIFNAVSTINVLPSGKVLYAANRFYSNIENAINATQPTLSPEEAIWAAANHLSIKTTADLKHKEIAGNQFIFKKNNISKSPIKVQLVYQPMAKDKLYLAWQLAINSMTSTNYWNLRIDALTGELLDKNNWATHCSFGTHQSTNNCGFLEKTNNTHFEKTNSKNRFKPENTGDTYRVFAVPVESPAHGDRSLVVDPADPVASPFGWHDTDGVKGAEYTITRGNNVHAYADPNDLNRSNLDEPNGGEELHFDFPFDPDKEPLDNQDAAVTQLFYMNNVMHDFSFRYGFDEKAGNFQEKNYIEPVGAGDYVEAEALDNANGGATDNASFGTPEDGGNGSMSMFVWSRGGGKLLHVTAPVGIAGDYDVTNASFGPRVEDMPIIGGTIVVANDGDNNAPTLACNPIENAEEIDGNIALIDRGQCDFVDKIRNAQAAGAIAALVCNFENSLVTMGTPSGDAANDITIPAVFMRSGDCVLLKQFINEGLVIDLELAEADKTGPDQLDGDLDNGIIAHEYAHGISIRLTGGRFNSNCLNNREQMGEGWSDFFTLITSVEPGDKGTDKRGIGTYVLRQGNDGVGIRRFPYSTDKTINPLTYKNSVATTTEHSLGEVWVAALWDLYWAMSDEYGWDPDLYNGTGGNNRAIQLVMDGMKIQACNPGFLDGRDAILAADQANYGGANQCLIWEIFAKRGMGFSASQGDNDDHNDLIEGYDVLPECIKTIKIEKAVTPSINAGEEIAVTLTITNHKEEMATNLVVTDELAPGTTYRNGSSNLTASAQGNQVQFEIPQLANGATTTITYTVETAPDKVSSRQFLDDSENGDDFWLPINLDEETSNIWDLQDAISNSGEFAWHVSNPPTSSQQFLQLDEEITVTGNSPALRFYHWHDTDPGTDGGIVEISTDGGSTWQDLAPHFIRNTYTGQIAYTAFAIPDRKAFWGNSEGFIPSYVDLRSFLGETIIIRFRFGSNEDAAGEASNYNGWFIDDVEFLDLIAYQSPACLTSAGGDNVCVIAPEGGTIVEVGELSTHINDLEDAGLHFAVFPNPAQAYLNISLSNEKPVNGAVSLFNVNGQELLQRAVNIDRHTQFIPFNVSGFPGGFYFVKVITKEGIAVRKVALEMAH